MRSALNRPGLSLMVVLVALLLGAALVGPLVSPNPASALTTYTRSVSCAGGSFLPNDSETTYAMSATGRVRTSLLGNGVFRCDPGIPHGAVVTQVRFTLFDYSVNANVGPCSLKRHTLQLSAPPNEELMASVNATAFAPGGVRPSDSSINFAAIDASKYAYWLECSIDYNNANVGILGADITFTITAAKG